LPRGQKGEERGGRGDRRRVDRMGGKREATGKGQGGRGKKVGNLAPTVISKSRRLWTE